MRTDPDKLKRVTIRLAVDQDKIGPYMAIAMIDPFANQRMVKIAVG